MVNTILAKRINHIVAKGDNPVWPKGSKSRGFSTVLIDCKIYFIAFDDHVFHLAAIHFFYERDIISREDSVVADVGEKQSVKKQDYQNAQKKSHIRILNRDIRI